MPRSYALATFPNPVISDPSTEFAERIRRINVHRSDWAVSHWDVGVPWVEAAAATLYSEELEREIADRRRIGIDGYGFAKPRYLATTPLNQSRDGLALYWGTDENQALPAPWNGYDFGDTQVRDAYLAHCIRMVNEHDPIAFCYAAEANFLLETSPSQWTDFEGFLQIVYAGLKSEFPTLPVFISFQLGPVDRDSVTQLAAIDDLRPYTDWFGISGYPFLDAKTGGGTYDDPDDLPADWITQVLDLDNAKPWGIVETGYPAASVTIDATTIRGTEERQKRYLELLLALCETRSTTAQCVIWSCPTDYEAIWDQISGPLSLPEFVGSWRTCGLMTDGGAARWALRIWDQTRAIPLE